MNKRYLALNNLQCLICHKTKPTNATNVFGCYSGIIALLELVDCKFLN